MTSFEAATVVKALNIPKPVLARLAGLHDAQVYNFLDGKATTALNQYKITSALGELSRWIQVLPFPPDMRNWRAVQDALYQYRVKHLKEAGAEKVREEFGEAPAHDGDYLEAETQRALEATAGLGSKK